MTGDLIFSRPYLGIQELRYQAVRIRVLDHQGRAVCSASGFLMRQAGELHVYTAWHVVSGFKIDDPTTPRQVPDRHSVVIDMVDNKNMGPGITALTDRREILLPLSTAPQGLRRSEPIWEQDEQDIARVEPNAQGVRVPRFHDLVRIRLPVELDFEPSPMQVVDPVRMITVHEGMRQGWSFQLGEPLFVVGYPYGFSAGGDDRPTPVVLTRHLAAESFGDRRSLLLDGDAAPGMSGGPVFVIREGVLVLAGMYLGNIYPDHAEGTTERSTTLGRVESFLQFDPRELCPHLPVQASV